MVSVLDSGAEGPGFKLQSLRCRVTVLGKLFTTIVNSFVNKNCSFWVLYIFGHVLLRNIAFSLYVVTHTCTQPFNSPLSGLPAWAGTRKIIHPLTPILIIKRPISFLYLLQSIASSWFNLHVWQPFSTTSLQVLFGLHLGVEPSTSYSIHFFTQSFYFLQHMLILSQPVLFYWCSWLLSS